MKKFFGLTILFLILFCQTIYSFAKINEAEYIHNYGNSDSNLVKNNIRSNSNTNSNTDKYNIKPIILKTSDKFHQGNNYNYYQNNLNIKFNNIIKTNSYGIVINKINGLNNITDNNIVSLKNITLTKLKKPQRTDEIKLKKRMPTLTSHMHVNKNNNFNEDNTLGKQRRFITNDNVKRKTNQLFQCFICFNIHIITNNTFNN